MVNEVLQVFGFLLTVLGWLLSIVTCSISSWKRSDVKGEVIESITRTTGLWIRCTQQATGHWTCDNYDSYFLGLPVPLQGARATTLLSLLLGFFGILLAIFGLSCTTIAAENARLKARMVVASGMLHVAGGVSLGTGVCWFAATVLQDYQNPGNQVSAGRYVYGEALFVGWAAMVVGILGGIAMCISSWSTKDDDHHHHHHHMERHIPPYTYNPPRPKQNSTEYI
uniref:Claudin n=1 Tax=Halocynthia roretzi TaxID=7729 RepID=Q9N9W2_HALRO|nr:putative claudin [Halocynthia roretzi]